MDQESKKYKPTKEQQPVTPLGPPTGMGIGFKMGELTPRETEVAALLVLGLTYKQIGEELKIGRRTVGYHITTMLERFNIHNCAHKRVALAAALSRKP